MTDGELDIVTYSKMKTWGEKFDGKKVSLKKIQVKKSDNVASATEQRENVADVAWDKIFEKLYNDKRFDELECELEKEKGNAIYPLPDLVFNAFNLTSFEKLKVVVLGQDPYFSSQEYKKIQVPQAMGLSFSVPHGVKVPSSLKNIYSNLKKFGHIKEIPDHGNLEAWASQGVLLLNSSLTVKDGTDNKNCHQHLWGWFTNEIISYISQKKENIIFVLWGRDAYSKLSLIDDKTHHVIASSHPSGLSANKPMGNYPAFNDVDHFGSINNRLKKSGAKEIKWDNNV